MSETAAGDLVPAKHHIRPGPTIAVCVAIAAVAGVKKLVGERVIRPGERVVAILTGHILKDPGLLLRYHMETDPPPPRANRPVEIEPALSAVEEVLGDRL